MVKEHKQFSLRIKSNDKTRLDSTVEQRNDRLKKMSGKKQLKEDDTVKPTGIRKKIHIQFKQNTTKTRKTVLTGDRQRR